MKIIRYPFAEVFIKIAIFLAPLTILVGLLSILGIAKALMEDLSSLKYIPKSNLFAQTKELQEAYNKTRERLAQITDDGTLPSHLPEIDLDASLKLAESEEAKNQPKIFLKLAQDVKYSIDQLKEFHSKAFVSSVDSLIKSLEKRVVELKQRYSVPKDDEKTEQKKNPDSEITTTENKTYFRVFQDDVNQDQNRMAILRDIRAFLDGIKEKAERQENVDLIIKAQVFITKIEALLNRPQRSREIIEDEEELPQKQIEANQMVSQAEILIQNLHRAKKLISDNFYTNWKVDNLVKSLIASCENELDIASQLDSQARQRINETFAEIGFKLIWSLSVAFGILVVSDFLKAFLNLSRNSDLIEKLLASANNSQNDNPILPGISSKEDTEPQI